MQKKSSMGGYFLQPIQNESALLNMVDNPVAVDPD